MAQSSGEVQIRVTRITNPSPEQASVRYEEVEGIDGLKEALEEAKVLYSKIASRTIEEDRWMGLKPAVRSLREWKALLERVGSRAQSDANSFIFTLSYRGGYYRVVLTLGRCG